MSANYTLAADAITQYRELIDRGERPQIFQLGEGNLADIQFGPGKIMLVGGAPAAGKTAFATQCIFDALLISQNLGAVICNVEMSQTALLERQLARISGIDLTTIQGREFSEEHVDRLAYAFQVLSSISDRLCFVDPPFSIANIAATMDEFAGDDCSERALMIDYLQRITPLGRNSDVRTAMSENMDNIRRIASQGVAVLAIAASARQRDVNGRSSYDSDSLGLASFRDSSELEYGADDAFVLTYGPNLNERVLRHLKARHSEPRDIQLRFDGSLQRFEAIDESVNRNTNIRAPYDVASLWDAIPRFSNNGEQAT